MLDCRVQKGRYPASILLPGPSDHVPFSHKQLKEKYELQLKNMLRCISTL